MNGWLSSQSDRKNALMLAFTGYLMVVNARVMLNPDGVTTLVLSITAFVLAAIVFGMSAGHLVYGRGE